MAQDFGWQRSAEAYARLYHKLAGVPMIESEESAPEPERVRVIA